MTREQEAQQKLFQFKQKVRNITEFPDSPVEGQDGQMKLFTISKEIQQLSDLFSTKFEQQQKSMEVQNKANEVLSNQVGRLSATVANLTTKIEDKVVHDKNPDLVISPYADPDAAEVAFVDSALPAEAYYPCSTTDLAQPVGIAASRLGTLFKNAGIQGNPRFHYAIKTGKSMIIQRYKATAIKELLDRAKANKVPGIKLAEIDKIAKYFRLQQLLIDV